MLGSRMDEFARLFNEFDANYLSKQVGEDHFAFYQYQREQAKKNYAEIQEAVRQGRDVTDAVLLKLLPHRNSQTNIQRGAWIHIAPSVMKDVKEWYQKSGVATGQNWSEIAQAILDFVQRCVDDPSQLEAACQDFSNHSYSKGFQTGMMTPILNALRPDDFILVNNKSRSVFNYFLGKKYSSSLSQYPAINEDAHRFIQDNRDIVAKSSHPDAAAADILDMFSHWMVGVRKFFNPEKAKLAAPFSSMFSDADEATWAINLMQTVANLIGVQDADHPLAAFTYRHVGGEHRIRLDYGAWLIFGLNGKGGAIRTIHIALAKDALSLPWLVTERFHKPVSNPQIMLYELAITDFRENEAAIMVKFSEAAKTIIECFHNWKTGAHNRYNNPALESAILYPEAREGVFSTGIKASPGPEEQTAEGVAEPHNGDYDIPSDRLFDAQAFDLLERLRQNPTAMFYTENKRDIQEKVEHPFQKLMQQAATRLRPEITERMETQKNVFARFHKNDFGRGGLWPYYWGAFYTKGKKRTNTAQLILTINPNRLEFGFSLADDTPEDGPRFRQNCASYGARLLDILDDMVSEPSFVIGGYRHSTAKLDGSTVPNNTVSWEDFFRAPEKWDYVVKYIVMQEKVVQMSAEQLIQTVADAFNRLFPLVLLSISDTPIPAIMKYLGLEEEQQEVQPVYPLEQCAEETGMEIGELRRWVKAIERKKQVVVFGPPGTGKTYLAQRLAQHLIGGGDGLVQLLQFHPEFSYEDFIQGIRPQPHPNGGLDYPIVPGRFLSFCQRAAERKGLCVLIIDEINRANLARVFGELMYLLEYREQSVELAAGRQFSIPANVRIIGTMNTADRSIALVDHALRRRFAFLPLYPNYDILRRYHEREGTGFPVDGLVEVLESLNKQINDRHYMVGPSYFLRKDLAAQIADIWQMEIEPYLEEYFFDQPDKQQRFCWQQVSGKILG